MSRFKVNLKSIKLFGYHGILKEEQENGQDFRIDVKYKFDKKNEADEIESTIDYSEIYLTVKKTFDAKRYNLLENLVQDIAEAILTDFASIGQVKITAWKDNPSVGGKLEAVGVTTKATR